MAGCWKETKHLRGVLRCPWRWGVHMTNMRESLAEQSWGDTVMGSQAEATTNDKDAPGISPVGEPRTPC